MPYTLLYTQNILSTRRYGKTPVMDEKKGKMIGTPQERRVREIRKYLKDHPEIQTYIAVDDMELSGESDTLLAPEVRRIVSRGLGECSVFSHFGESSSPDKCSCERCGEFGTPRSIVPNLLRLPIAKGDDQMRAGDWPHAGASGGRRERAHAAAHARESPGGEGRGMRPQRRSAAQRAGMAYPFQPIPWSHGTHPRSAAQAKLRVRKIVLD